MVLFTNTGGNTVTKLSLILIKLNGSSKKKPSVEDPQVIAKSRYCVGPAPSLLSQGGFEPHMRGRMSPPVRPAPPFPGASLLQRVKNHTGLNVPGGGLQRRVGSPRRGDCRGPFVHWRAQASPIVCLLHDKGWKWPFGLLSGDRERRRS